MAKFITVFIEGIVQVCKIISVNYSLILVY